MNPVYSPVQPGAPYGNPKNMAYTGEWYKNGLLFFNYSLLVSYIYLVYFSCFYSHYPFSPLLPVNASNLLSDLQFTPGLQKPW